jgi:hypothetical protein
MLVLLIGRTYVAVEMGAGTMMYIPSFIQIEGKWGKLFLKIRKVG